MPDFGYEIGDFVIFVLPFAGTIAIKALFHFDLPIAAVGAVLIEGR